MTRALARGLTVALVLSLLPGCCWLRASRQPETLVVVVPSRHDGHVGAVVVTRGDEQQVLDSAYAAVRMRSSGRLRRTSLDAGDVQQMFAAASEALPTLATSYTLYFDLGTHSLTAESRAKLDEVLQEVSRRPAAEVVVVGHTDRMGDAQDNESLSLRRAQRLRDLVVRRGVPRELVQTLGMGEREPVVPTDDDVAEPRNRRVEIIVR